MNDARFVGGVNRPRHQQHQPDGIGNGLRLVSQGRGQRATRDEFHDDRGTVRPVVKLVDLDDMLVRKQGLAALGPQAIEPPAAGLTGSALHALEGDDAVQHRVARLPRHAHAAFAEVGQDFEPRTGRRLASPRLIGRLGRPLKDPGWQVGERASHRVGREAARIVRDSGRFAGAEAVFNLQG